MIKINRLKYKADEAECKNHIFAKAFLQNYNFCTPDSLPH